MKNKLPIYVRLGEKGSTLRLDEDKIHGYTYWRHAGMWGINIRYLPDGTLVSVSPYSDNNAVDYLNDKPLIEVTEEEWRDDNEDYI